MISQKQNENIYGYTGKKNYKFFSSSSSSIKKSIDLKDYNKNTNKPIEVQLKPQNIIKNIKFHCINDYILCDCEENIIDLDKWYKNDSFNTLIILNRDGYKIATMDLLTHEKGYSVRLDTFDIYISIEMDGENETISISNDLGDLSVYETKFSFDKLNYPFHYKYEINKDCDGIFNDFILEHLSELNPPNQYTVPVKKTNNNISFRQYISYMKTTGFLKFIIDESGWNLQSFENVEENNNCVNGVCIPFKNYWTYFPRGKRIEHSFIFL